MDPVRLGKCLLLAASLSAISVVPGADGGSSLPSLDARASGTHLVFTSRRDGDVDVYAASPRGRVAALTRNRELDDEVVISRNGRWLAVQRDLNKLVLVSGDGRRERELGAGTPVSFAPSGRLLAFRRNQRMFVVRVPGGRPRRLGRGSPIAFSPNGRLLAFDAGAGRKLGISDVRTRRRRTVPRSASGDFIGWSHDSRLISFRRVEDTGDGQTQTLLVADVRRLSSAPTELASGERVAAEWLTATRLGYQRDPGGARCEAGVVSADGSERQTFGPVACFSVDWSPDGEHVAYSRFVNERSDLVLAQADGSGSKVVYRGPNLSIQWSPRARWLAVTTDNELDDDLLVVRSDGERLVRIARGNFYLSYAGSWSPDERHLAVEIEGGLGIVDVPAPKVRRIWNGSLAARTEEWVTGPLPRAARTAAPAPKPEVAEGRVLRSRGAVNELAADGFRVAALLGPSRSECDHVVAWMGGTQRVTRFSRPAPCTGYTTYDFGLTLSGTKIDWRKYFCGNYCYVAGCRADILRPYRHFCGDGDEVPKARPPRPPPPDETRRGVSIVTREGTIQLTRAENGSTHTISPPGGAVDAELEDAGLFYAFNLRGREMPGRIVFVPFSALFD